MRCSSSTQPGCVCDDDRRSELEQLIGDDIEEIDDGAIALRLPSGGMTTLWWEKPANARAP